MEVISFLKASWEEWRRVEEKVKAKEEPLTRQKGQKVTRGKKPKVVKVGHSYITYNLISKTIIQDSQRIPGLKGQVKDNLQSRCMGGATLMPKAHEQCERVEIEWRKALERQVRGRVQVRNRFTRI